MTTRSLEFHVLSIGAAVLAAAAVFVVLPALLEGAGHLSASIAAAGLQPAADPAPSAIPPLSISPL